MTLRSAGAPARTRSHREAIKALLRERGKEGVLGSEFYDAPHLYGRSPRNRISELRRDGYQVRGEPHGSADWRYWLIESNPDAKPSPRSDWTMDRVRTDGQGRPAPTDDSRLPLFDMMVRP